MVPRAYAYTSAPSQPSKQQKMAQAQNPIRQSSTRQVEPTATKKQTSGSKPSRMTTISPAVPSKPVVIPTRTGSHRRPSNSHTRADRLKIKHNVAHDIQAVPPSVAAFLAITDIRQKPTLLHRSKRLSHQNEKEDLEEGADNELGGSALSASSPCSWRLLLSPPQDIVDDECSGFGSDDNTLGSFSPLRSLSNESMPSLDTDNESGYASSSPSTPGLAFRGHGTRERRLKSISSSVPEDSNSNHPLLVVDPEQEHVGSEDESSERKRSAPARPSLRSNLTASLRRIKSAARTFSNLTTPTPSQDESPPQASLSALSKFVPERRPLPWAEPPDPALRRYLNPITISPAELYSHRNREERGPKPTASIQLQSYSPGAKKSEKASTPPIFMHASSQAPLVAGPAVSTTPRQREPRENSDFLRVIVLEMNMRKVGKLSDVTPGRAKLWLPARQAPTQNEDAGDETPRRWVSVSQ
ncbi:MAG: hypothetical protein L6R41_003217 [Letrouitia leprolyta]|nr:MAG: hypothetical protein L6R41_003217 [Letrouitia leprolyta]